MWCWLFGHKYKGPDPDDTIPTSGHFLFRDWCVRCGHENRFWHTDREMGLDTQTANEMRMLMTRDKGAESDG